MIRESSRNYNNNMSFYVIFSDVCNITLTIIERLFPIDFQGIIKGEKNFLLKDQAFPHYSLPKYTNIEAHSLLY